MVERLRHLHPRLAHRLHMLPNGFAPELLGRRAVSGGPRDGRLTLIHPGVLYGDRSIDDLLSAITAAGIAERLRLQLVGNLNAASQVALQSAPPGLDIEIIGPRPWAATMDLVADADVVVVIVPASMGDDVAWPVKMFEALALGKPILAITAGGATEHLLTESASATPAVVSATCHPWSAARAVVEGRHRPSMRSGSSDGTGSASRPSTRCCSIGSPRAAR